jgi:dienelactone hydrolase
MTSEWVSIPVDGQDMRVYRAQPETAGQVPGVLVIMEALGVHTHIQEVTDKLAREGYVATAPVLYTVWAQTPYSALTTHGKVCDIKIYPGADHGFNRDERPSYYAEASQDAWGRTLGWFQRY